MDPVFALNTEVEKKNELLIEQTDSQNKKILQIRDDTFKNHS
jgi:hypothetical protein